MDQSRSTLADVALFVEVARTASFRLAAARLEMPPSTLSRRIAALEARLGVALFARTTRSVALTSAAKPYFERCLEVLAAAERAQAALDGGQQRQARMRIATPVDLAWRIGKPMDDRVVARRGVSANFSPFQPRWRLCGHSKLP